MVYWANCGTYYETFNRLGIQFPAGNTDRDQFSGSDIWGRASN